MMNIEMAAYAHSQFEKDLQTLPPEELLKLGQRLFKKGNLRPALGIYMKLNQRDMIGKIGALLIKSDFFSDREAALNAFEFLGAKKKIVEIGEEALQKAEKGNENFTFLAFNAFKKASLLEHYRKPLLKILKRGAVLQKSASWEAYQSLFDALNELGDKEGIEAICQKSGYVQASGIRKYYGLPTEAAPSIDHVMERYHERIHPYHGTMEALREVFLEEGIFEEFVEVIATLAIEKKLQKAQANIGKRK